VKDWRCLNRVTVREHRPAGQKGSKGNRLLGDIRNTDEAILFFPELSAEVGDSYRGDVENFSLFGKRKKGSRD
jgi:hypothetical protein